MKKLLARAGHALRVVVHDPQVDRAGIGLAAIVAVRLALALGASAADVALIQHLFDSFVH